MFSREELDQMVASIALHPDPLLAQVLMAATYPGNVADAVAWSRAHPDAKGTMPCAWSPTSAGGLPLPLRPA
ncbi:DUF3300 domain-containing protein [Luteimonas kalidii]|uniref:DUF3300 domain-containing protein n=1 Tax=Luteimonas kalidii TaxID=3042025 RepID=A0ABT6JSY4_9GAMM|nr:DUF3300 domain-containing protein [Luteimonas kalidii]MDH5833580.1 DUF3300 domain-containing protein [Luteimonas kalidii]